MWRMARLTKPLMRNAMRRTAAFPNDFSFVYNTHRIPFEGKRTENFPIHESKSECSK